MAMRGGAAVFAVFALVAGMGIGFAPGSAAAGRPCLPTAEIFATNNTAIITDPNDPRLRTRLIRFDRQVREIIAANGALPGGSTLLDGVFWSDTQQQTTYERSREFDVNHVSAAGLHHLGDVLAKRFDQESVLTFQFLPRPAADSVQVEVPGVTVQELYNGMVADPTAREQIGGGSVTVNGGRLILIAAVSDLALVRRFVGDIGADWSTATVVYGHLEFVS